MIQKSVNASNRNILILSVLALIIAGVGAYFVSPYFLAKFSEPTRLDEAALSSLTLDSGPLYFQEIKAEEVIDIGYEEYTEFENGSQRTDAYFAAAWIGDTLVIIRTADAVDEARINYVGALVKPSSIQREIFDDFQREVPELTDALVPLVFDTIDKEFQWYGGAAVLAVLLLGGIWGVITFAQRSSNPANHPIFKKLAPYGDVTKSIDDIEAELALAETVGKLKLTKNWAVYQAGATFEAIPHRDLVWVYKFIQKGKYGTKTFYAYICDKHGKVMQVPAKEEQVNAMLQACLTYAPWALGGYSDEIKAAWDRDRQQLVAAVEQRKVQIRQQGAQA